VTRRRWRHRGIAVAVIAGVSAIANAALPGDLQAEPPVIEIVQPLGTVGSGSGTVRNYGVSAGTITEILADGACSTTGITAQGDPNAMFSVPPNGAANIRGYCPAGASYGIRRCLQHMMNGPTTMGDVTVLCSTANGLTLTGPATLTVPDAVVNTTGSTTMVTITNPLPNPTLTGASIQVGDQEGDFTIGAPCFQDGLGCDATFVTLGDAFDISVTCTPKSLGLHTAPLYVVASNGARLATPVMLSCNGTAPMGTSPAISTNQSSVMLMQAVNAGSASTTVRLSSAGDLTLDISSIQITGADWSVSVTAPCMSLPAGCSLAPTEFVDATVVFSPSVLGTRNGNLVINSSDPGQPVLTIPLYGTGQGAVLVPDTALGLPPMLDLGGVPVGFQTTSTFTLRNDGDLALDPVNLSTTGVFSLATTQTTIAAASPATLSVTCTPTSVGDFSSAIVVDAPNAVTGSPLSIMVRCQGTSGSFYAMPASVQLGEIRVNTPAVRRSIMLLSVGPTLDISSGPTLANAIAGMSVTAAAPTPFSPLAPGVFELEVLATVDADLANTIAVATITGGSIEIPVTGQVVTPDVEVPAAILAGSFCVGQSTMPTTTKLDASGTASIMLPTRPVMAAGAGSPFQVSYTSPVMYPYRLAAGASASVEITPLRQTMPGMRSDALVWATDSPGETAAQTTVTAEFIADGGAVAPQTIDFGGKPLRQAAEPHLIRIQNCGTEPMALLGATVTPSDEFRDLSPEPLPALLQPNQLATMTVGFVPRRVGSRMGLVTIESSKGPLNVTLLGTGLGDPGITGEPISFYACDCATSDPSGAWPAVLVIVALRRRRRR